MSRQLNAATSIPTASWPDSSDWTSVVPDPANGSRTRPPGRTYRPRSASTSCGTNLPRYGWSRWTCFVRSRSGSSASDHESSSSPAISPYSAACVGAMTAPSTPSHPVLRQTDPLDPSPANPGCLDRDLEAGDLWMCGDPRARRGENPPALLGADHLERMPVLGTPLLLHLHDDEAAPSPQDEVELVPAGACIRVEESVAAEPVVQERAPLAAVHATAS